MVFLGLISLEASRKSLTESILFYKVKDILIFSLDDSFFCYFSYNTFFKYQSQKKNIFSKFPFKLIFFFSFSLFGFFKLIVKQLKDVLNLWLDVFVWVFRNSRPEVFSKKDVFKNFAKFTGTHLYPSLFFDKATLWKKRLRHSWLSVNFAEFLRTPFFKEYLRWLLLLFEFC